MRNEIWKPVDGLGSGVYEVSDQGVVRHIDTLTPAKTYDVNGYVRVYYKSPIAAMEYVHRLVCRTFHGLPQDGQEVNHLNGIKNDNRAVNVEWTTRQGNQIHGVQTGLFHSVFTAEQVLFVRQYKWRYGEKSQWCRDNGIKPSALNNVLKRLVWDHI